ncbi:unnamed protein product [Gongylonema pulchrum]|uniref:Uncharacterized protein n=1 Tax=Gongylonema pulchrum TaxID=637853 RepID=A0A183D1K2_9BILA|nr:unnamed protein product [Gongylonema pulchrum]
MVDEGQEYIRRGRVLEEPVEKTWCRGPGEEGED